MTHNEKPNHVNEYLKINLHNPNDQNSFPSEISICLYLKLVDEVNLNIIFEFWYKRKQYILINKIDKFKG